MTNADLLEETYATALGAEGSAEKELENYQQGVQYSIDVFKASWEELSNTILSSDLVKTVVDIGSGIVSAVNTIISSFGGLQTAAAGFLAVFAVKNWSGIKDFFGFGSSTTQFTAGFTSSMSTATTAATGLNAIVAKTGMSLGALASTAVGIAGVGAAIYAVYEYATRFDRAMDTATESLSNFQTEQGNLDTLNAQTDDLKTQLESLADTYNINVDGLDDVDAMIDKIESSADTSLTITDKATLEDLRAQNTELERQIALQEQVVDTSQAQALADAQKVLSMQATTDLTTQRTQGDIYGFGYETSTYDTTDIITATQNEINKLGELMDARREDAEEAKSASGEKLNSINEEIAGYDYEIDTYKNAISEQLESLGEIQEALVGTPEYDIISSLQEQFNNIDLSPLQRELASIDSYFSTDGMDAVKDSIMDAVSAGETATDAFERMGLSLSDIGANLDPETFNAYFDELIAGAEETEEAIGEIEGTVDSMSAAAETANQNANWESAASLLSDAKDLYEKGLIGTDDFKEAAQYMSPEKLLPNEDDYKYDANAYVKAWEDAQSKVKRYFDADNPADSMINALNDLTKAGLATNEGDGLYEWTDQFTNSKEAADAFGISVAAAEDILHGLEAYGADVSDIFFSSEGLSEYEGYLNSLESVYDSMSEGDSKNRIGSLIEGFDADYAEYEDDITKLDKDAIVHIQFEYNLASIEAEVQNLRDTIDNGDKSVSNYAKLIGANQEYINTAKEGTGLNVEGIEIPVQFTNLEDRISELKSELAETTDEDVKMNIQADIANLQDIEKNLLTAFSESEYGVNIDAESSVEEVQSAWDGFLNSVEGKDLIANLDLNDEEAVQALAEITDMSEKQIKMIIDADNSPALSAFASFETLANDNIHVNIDGDTESIKNDLDSLSLGNTLIFTADVGDVETAIAGVQTMDGVINYVVDESVDVDEAKKAISEITNQEPEDIRVNVVADTDKAMQELSRLASEKYDSVKIPSELETDAVKEAIDSVGKGTTTVTFEADVDGISRVITEYTEKDGTIVYSTDINGVNAEVKAVENLAGVITYTTEIDADTSSAIEDFVSLETLLGSTTINIDMDSNADEIVAELESLDTGNTLIFTADVGEVETAIAGIQTMDGVINYVVDESVDVDEAKRAISEITEQSEDEIVIYTVADTDRAMHDIDSVTGGDHNVEIIAEPSGFDEIEEAVAEAGEEQTVRFIASVDGVETIVDACKNEDGTIAYTASIDGVESDIAAVENKDGTISFTADTSGINSSDFDENATVTYDANTAALPTSFDDTATVTYHPDTRALPSSFSTITRYVNYVATGDTGGASVNGTARASGTAHAGGTAKATGDVDEWSTEVNRGWLTKKSETALTGELGRELVVDTKNNRWYTVGDNGAEFSYIPAGSIVFNHKQTEELLTTGSTNGTAHASGTAYGGVQIKTSSSSSSSKSSSSSSSSKSSSSSSSSKSSSSSSSSKKKSSSSSSSSKDFEESLDWIEIEIDRIERAIDRLDLKAESTYNNWTKRNENLFNEISKINEEIEIQQQAYDRYIQEANSVGLASNYVTLVQNGAIDISTITDEDLADQIKDYQEWYEKALDCQDAIDQLTESVKELYEEAFQNVIDEFEAILNVYEHQANMLQGYIKQSEAQGYITSTQYYTALIENEQEQISYLEEERTRLVNALNDAVQNGGIEEYSESWYKMCAEIDKVDEAIQDATTSVIEFGNSIRDIEWEIFDLIEDNISHITTEADFLIDLMSSQDMYDSDTGEITDVGRATFGLHAVNYNTYMEQADDYAKEIEEIDKELAEDPYNQDLLDRRQELLELQQQSILSAEDEKQAIKDLVEDGINAELDALQDLIDSYTDLLDTEKD